MTPMDSNIVSVSTLYASYSSTIATGLTSFFIICPDTQIACRNRSGRYKLGRKVTGISFVRGEREDWKQKNTTQSNESTSALENSFTKLTEAGNRVVKRMSLPFKGSGTEAEALRYTERMLVSTNDSRVRLYGKYHAVPPC